LVARRFGRGAAIGAATIGAVAGAYHASSTIQSRSAARYMDGVVRPMPIRVHSSRVAPLALPRGR
jgi:hypothetical protein